MEDNKMYVGIALALNAILNDCKLGDLDKDDTMKLLENKFKLTKIADDFEKKFSVAENFKTDRYKELEKVGSKSEEEEAEFKAITKQIEGEINGLRMEEATKEINPELEPISTDTLMKFIAANKDLKLSQSELLYKYMK